MSSSTQVILDPPTDDPYFFEGAEKLLEIWFAKEDDTVDGSLRNIPRDEIEKMLDVAQCHILHYRSNMSMDSYVLSESSAFVSDNRLILKTCGGTRLLETIPHILTLAKSVGFNEVSNIYYSRKNFLCPQLQPDPHKCFNDEVDFLLQYFPLGEAYCLGPLKSSDCWYLFAMSKSRPTPKQNIDHTLEIQMTELPSEILGVYSKAACQTGRECTRKSGLFDLMPLGAEVHEELFEPVGYSMNALVEDTDQYISVHVTPEEKFTYVSFETNQRTKCLYKQTLEVLKCFKPQKFIMTLFTNKESHNGNNSQQRLWYEEIPGYRRVALQFVRLASDTLVYAQFVKINELHEFNSDDDEDSHGSSD